MSYAIFHWLMCGFIHLATVRFGMKLRVLGITRVDNVLEYNRDCFKKSFVEIFVNFMVANNVLR